MNKADFFDDCREDLRQIIDQAGCRCAFAVNVRFRGQEQQCLLGDSGIFPAASTIKLAILLELFRGFACGRMSPDERLTVAEKDIVEGGVLPECGAGHAFSLMELARLMMIVSDNTASNLILERVGMSAVNGLLRGLGLKYTLLRRRFMEDPQLRGDNTATAEELLRLLVLLDDGEIVGEPWRSEALSIMHRQMFVEKIPAELPAEVWTANKVGELEGVRHDIAVLASGELRMRLAALTQNVRCGCEGDRLISKLAKTVWMGAAQSLR